MKAGEKEWLEKWEAYKKSTYNTTAIDLNESQTEKNARIAKLLKSFPDFCKYYFPKYCKAEFAKFHLDFANKVIKNEKWVSVQAWSREHAKSVVGGLFLPVFLKFIGESKVVLYISHNEDNAKRLLMPLMLELESNQRIINDFGVQKGWKNWTEGDFITKDGCSYRALGAGQSPRGARMEDLRPDLIMFDDIDTDEETRNQSRIDTKWKWIEEAAMGTISISGKQRFIFLGNIISKESCIVKASRIADHFQKINILDKDGKPSWNKNSLKDIQYVLSKRSYAAVQKEYFNNPITEGTVFKELTYGKVPPLSSFKFLVSYTDPSFSDSKKGDFKATLLLGMIGTKLYVIKAYVAQATTAEMIQWHYDIDDYVSGRVPVYYYIEGKLNNIGDFVKKFEIAGDAKGKYINIQTDERSKPDKFTRIEAALEPLNRNGNLILNEAEAKTQGMKTLEDQFKAIEPKLTAHDDGPDACEGGYWVIKNKTVEFNITVGNYKRSKHKY